MTWAKIDDQLHAHRKVKKAWKAHRGSLGLHLLAMSYCAGHLTDGLVDDEFVEEKLPNDRERVAITDALVAAGLWGREDDGWRINDWLDFNPSRADVEERRRRDADRKATRRRGESTKRPRGHAADTDRNPADPSRAGASPDPTRPDPVPLDPPPAGERKRQREKWEGEALVWARAVGVDGNDVSLLRALRQSEPWKLNGAAPEHFRGFARQYFPGSLMVADEA